MTRPTAAAASLSPRPSRAPAGGLLMVGNFLSGAGGRRAVCEDLADRLRASGWAVLTTSDRPERIARAVAMLRATWAWRRDYGVAQVDVYSGAAFFWAAAVSFLLRRLRKPFILSLHGGNLPGFARRWPRLVRRTLSSARAVTAPSAYLAREMKPYRAEIELLPNAVEGSGYRRQLRSQARPRVVWVRAFHAMYNPSLGPEVLARLIRDFPDAALTMVGPDKGDGSLEDVLAAAARLGVADRLRVVRGVPRDQVGAFLAEADVFLNTTNVDNTPVSVMEAMACGLCVVSTDVGGLPDLIERERDGVLVPPGDPEAMAAAVRRILADPGLASRLSANALAKADSWEWSALLPRWEALIREAADA